LLGIALQEGTWDDAKRQAKGSTEEFRQRSEVLQGSLQVSFLFKAALLKAALLKAALLKAALLKAALLKAALYTYQNN
jgi:hypothetical protein